MKRGMYREQDYGFGQTILTLRTAIGLTQAGLASALGVSRQSVAEWEAGGKYPKAKHLQSLLKMAVEHQAFPAGREAEEIRSIWKASHQKVLLDEQWLKQILPGVQAHEELASLSQPVSSHVRFYWDNALSADTFYGREQERALLTQWLVEEHCRVVSLLGLGGIGKSALTVNLMRTIAEQYEVVIWRSLRDIPTCYVLITDLLQVLAPQALGTLDESFEQRLAVLMEQMRTTRILLVLDNTESVLNDSDATGQMRPGYEGFGHFLHQCAETRHQSSILLTSRQTVADLVVHQSKVGPVRTLRLSALDSQACEQLLRQRDVSGSTEDLTRLIDAYTGNPLALKIVAQTIVDLFGGDIAPFLQQAGVIFGEIHELLHEHYKRLTPTEQRVIFWLAIMREPITLKELSTLFTVPLPSIKLIETMNSLYRHSLVERGQTSGTFTLQSVVLEYVTEQLIAEASSEIQHGNLAVLLQHGLEQAQVKAYIRETQTRLLVTPLLRQLQHTALPDVEAHINHLMDTLRDMPIEQQGYGPANLAALLRVLRGHLSSVDLSRVFLRGASFKDVDMHDTQLSGSMLRDCDFNDSFDSIISFSQSASGEYWATVSFNGEIRIWRAGGYDLSYQWRDSEYVGRVSLSADGRFLAGGCWNGTLKLWDLTTGLLRWSKKVNDSLYNFYSIAFSPDARVIVTGGSNNVVCLWDLASGDLIETLDHPTAVGVTMWFKDGSGFASADDEGTIRFWDFQPNQPTRLRMTIAAHKLWISSMVLSPTGDQFASCSFDQTVKVWRTADGFLQETLTAHQDIVYRVAWSGDGRTIASAGKDNLIWLWDVEQRRYHTALRGHTAFIRALAATPDGKSIVSGSEDSTLRVWDISSGACTRIMHGYGLSVHVASWSPDGRYITSFGSDALITVYDFHGEKPPRILTGLMAAGNDVLWTPDGRFIITSRTADIVRMWDAQTGDALKNISFLEGFEIYAGITWKPNGPLMIAMAPASIHALDLATGKAHPVKLDLESPPHIMHWSPNAEMLGAICDNGVGYVWNADFEVLLEWRSNSTQPFTSWTTDSTRLATVERKGETRDSQVLIWDFVRGERLPLLKYSGYITDAVWLADGPRLVTSSDDGILRWWDTETGDCLQEVKIHAATIHSLKPNPARTLLLSSGDDGATVVCDILTGELVRVLRRDRPYERLDITGIRGLTDAQKTTLRQLGAVEILSSKALNAFAAGSAASETTL